MTKKHYTVSQDPNLSNPPPNSQKTSNETCYMGQNGIYNFDLTFGDFFIVGLGPRRGML